MSEYCIEDETVLCCRCGNCPTDEEELYFMCSEDEYEATENC